MVKILVADDEWLICDLLRRILSPVYEVVTAINGREALALFEQHRPQITLLDLVMPEMNGIEVLRRLRAQGYQGGVITLTASQDRRLLQEMLELGSVDVVGKPVDLDRLALVVQVALALA